MDLKEKANYLNRLVEDSNLDFGEEKNRIVKSALDLIQELAKKVQDLDAICSEHSDLIDEIDQDLAEIEDNFYEDYDEDEEEKDEEEKNKLNSGKKDEDSNYEVSCPNCKRVIELDDDAFKNEEVICPECKEKIELEFEEE